MPTSIKKNRNNVRMLTRKQHAVIDDLFTADFSEQQILDIHGISRRLYEKWLADETFAKAFLRRLDSARMQSDLLIARYTVSAVAKLIGLTDSTSPETARKACLDIITLLRPDSKRPDSQTDNPADPPAELPPDLASRLLSALVRNDG